MAKKQTPRTVMCVHKSTMITNDVETAKKNFQSQVAGGMSDIVCYDITDFKGYSDMVVDLTDKQIQDYEALSKKLQNHRHNNKSYPLQAKAVQNFIPDLKRHKQEAKSIGKVVKGRIDGQ